MRVFTIGFTKKPARRFFELLRTSGARRVVDVRLNNVSQLVGFAKRDDLSYFLAEICGMDYVHAPTTPAGARTRSSASPGRRSTRPAASSGSRPHARRPWWGGFSPSHNPLPRPWSDGGYAATPPARSSSTATASPSAAGARRGAPPVRRPGCRPASSTIAAAPPPAT